MQQRPAGLLGSAATGPVPEKPPSTRETCADAAFALLAEAETQPKQNLPVPRGTNVPETHGCFEMVREAGAAQGIAGF